MLGYIIYDEEYINVEEHEIKSFDILHKTDLNIFVVENNKVLYKIISYKPDIIENACYYGHIQVLKWFKNSGYRFKHYKYAINYAAQNGHVKILKWFKDSGYKFKYSEWAINWASLNGHVKILKWFKNSGYKLKYTKHAIIRASENNYVQILKWFKNINVKTKNNYFRGYNKN